MHRRNRYEVIVIGGGHAGAEAAWAAANLLRPQWDPSVGETGRVALITLDPAKIGAMSCNPAIGGLAKGQIVREVDALGGLMGLAIDATGIQFRILNASKGPAVRGPRAQADKYRYAAEVQRLLRTRPNLTILAGSAEDLLTEDGRCVGVRWKHSEGTTDLRSAAVVLTTGTFMRGLMHTGETRTAGGRVGETSAVSISDALRRHGFELGRLKTGTPPRLDRRTLDLTGLDVQPGDEQPQPFSALTGRGDAIADEATARIAHRFPVIEQRVCWITHTSAASHDLIRANLDRAPMYNGSIEAECGPRYCPSIEDKVVRFADRTSHHVFLEPESLDTEEVYCNGISTSLPADVQERIVRMLPGCERATILRYGYAVEYDMVWPHQIDATAMTKQLPGLLLAGQINGTSGYEEAAAQGVIAGINAVRYGRGDDLLRLRRDQAYIGVLMDDLVTKTPREPYRMFTSRAEHRLVLRSDNADERLTPLGWEIGTVNARRWRLFEELHDAAEALRRHLRAQRLESFARHPGCTAGDIVTKLNGEALPTLARDSRVVELVLADLLYAGYIGRHLRDVQRLAEQEATPLSVGYDYRSVPGLRTEAALTLEKFRPTTLGQAGRLAGVTPADLMIISVALRRA